MPFSPCSHHTFSRPRHAFSPVNSQPSCGQSTTRRATRRVFPARISASICFRGGFSLELQEANPHDAVTFVSVASSGASIPAGVLGPMTSIGDSSVPDLTRNQFGKVAALPLGLGVP